MMTHASINLTCLHCSNPNVPARPQMVKLLLNVCKLRLAQASLLAALGQKVSAVALAGLLSVAPLAPAIASEFGVMTEDIPAGYIIDDAGVLNSVTRGDLRQKLKALEEQTGYKVFVITVRKLEYDPDAFSFADKMIERWYPTAEQGDKKGLLLMVSAGKEGAISGGPAFMKAIGDDLIDGIVGDNIPIFTEEEKYNEAVNSSINRIVAVLEGKADPGGPERKDNSRRRTYKTKEETDKAKNVTSTVVITLLGIAFVVPMLQYYGYVSKD